MYLSQSYQVVRENPDAINVQPFKNQDHWKIKQECLSQGKLFEDPLFPPEECGLFVNRPLGRLIKWKRPKELVDVYHHPLFVHETYGLRDLNEGYFGNRWFVNGCNAVSLVPDLFAKVVPRDQVCNGIYYTGMFHFRFWVNGVWYDVVIDDRLPVYYDNKFVFSSNRRDPNEFWVPLLEKAYAKLFGNYESLNDLHLKDFLLDICGGVEENFNVRDFERSGKLDELWELLKTGRMLKTIMGASINVEKIDENFEGFQYQKPQQFDQLYLISRVAMIELEELGDKTVKLVRLVHPWNTSAAWKGSWSNKSEEWNSVSGELKTSLDFRRTRYGESWMQFEDFCRYFDKIQFCNLTNDAFSSTSFINKNADSGFKWNTLSFHGEWQPGLSAGGNGLGNDALYWTNPQFLISLQNPDLNDSENATILISLIQKFTREKRASKYGAACEQYIQFRLYRILNKDDAEKSKTSGLRFYASQLEKCGTSGNYENVRIVSNRFKLPLGDYLIIPSCYEANRHGEFLLRIFSEQPIADNGYKVLLERKDNLAQEDIFFYKSIVTTRENYLRDQDNDRFSVRSITTPIYERFDKTTYRPYTSSHLAKNCNLM